LHLLKDCGALSVVELDRLLLEQLVDVGITAIGVSAALDVDASIRVAALPNGPLPP
jgi:hypothetical protein